MVLCWGGEIIAHQYSLSTTRTACLLFLHFSFRMGYNVFHCSFIYRGYWSFSLYVVPFSYFPLLLISILCWRCSNFVMMGLGLFVVSVPRQWTLWKVMSLVMSGGILRWVVMKSLMSDSGLPVFFRECLRGWDFAHAASLYIQNSLFQLFVLCSNFLHLFIDRFDRWL